MNEKEFYLTIKKIKVKIKKPYSKENIDNFVEGYIQALNLKNVDWDVEKVEKQNSIQNKDLMVKYLNK